MSYFIDIIDTTSPLTKIVVESASASGIVLEWNGGDTKDEAAIVSSVLKFDMLTTTADDAAFINFFTGDEHKFKVYIKDSVDNAIIWQGYVLPDLYSEPYKNACFFVSFTATDGLGRLKGKYLPDEYYSREKSLIDVYCQILKLTGIELDLYFLPAIENFVNKDWNTIYIDTENFIDSKKKKDAYSILETLLQDTLCVCYQADNRWYIEGINQRNVRNVTYKKYDVDGIFVANVTYNRLLKNITPLVTPMITIIPPYNEITITHKKTAPSLPKTINKEVNDGWAYTTGVVKILANEWMGNGDFFTYCERPEYECVVYNKYYYTGSLTDTYPQDDTQWVSLKEKLFFSKGQKVKFEFVFKIKKLNADIPNPENMDLWINPFKYEIVFNGAVIHSNFNGDIADYEKVVFNSSGEAKLVIEHLFTEEGLFDFKIYGPVGKVFDTKILGIEINSADVEVIAFEEEEMITDLISGDFTIDKEVELTFSDDKSGVSKGFRLAKLKEQTSFFNEIEVPILYGFTLSDKFYSVVKLENAFLISKNQYHVYYGLNLVSVIAVVYNFNEGEQMVIQTSIPYTTGVFTVKKYAIDDVIESRTNWLQWTDAIYKIENSTYSKTVANIYRRIFNQAVEKLDVTALNAVKFNDIVLFKYVYEKDFFVLNCSWNLDENKTSLTLGRSHYKDANSTTPGDENIPPIVLAGDDIYIEDAFTKASLLATAYDPDGYIASQIWTKIVGGFGDVIVSQFDLATQLENLTEDFYTYQIQVTDNDGATAVDTVNIVRIKNYILSLDIIDQSETTTASEVSKSIKYKLNVTPQLLPGYVLKTTGFFELSELTNASVGDFGSSSYKIEKNGAEIDFISESQGIYRHALLLNMISTDEIYITLSASASHGDFGTNGNVDTTINISEAVFISGNGLINGVPLVKIVSVSL